MSVTPTDVRHIADLARLGIEESRIPSLVAELNGILAHMDVLSRADTTGAPAAEGVSSGGTPLRPDSGPPLPMRVAIQAFAPETQDGFILVPRLATHVDREGEG